MAIRNNMLMGVLERVEYLKTKRNKKGQGGTEGNANFTLQLYPRTPEDQ